MKKMLTVAFALAAAILSGCAIYDGAIFSSYQQTDISIRSQPETATPVKLNFGHEQAVVTFVPHRDDRENGEAVSLFGWTNTSSITVRDVLSAAQDNVTAAQKAAAAASKTAAEANKAAEAATASAAQSTPETAQQAVQAADAAAKEANAAAEQATKAADAAETTRTASAQSSAVADSTGELLRAQGRFATGNAAKVLAIPNGFTVVLQKNAGDKVTIPIKTSAANRVAMLFPKLPQQTYRDVTEEIMLCSNVEEVYQEALKTVDSCFRTKVPTKRNQTNAQLFTRGRLQYLDATECPGTRDEKREKVNQTLERSLRNTCKKTQ